MIAHALHLHDSTIVRNVDDYVQNDKLKPAKRGSKSYLTEE